MVAVRKFDEDQTLQAVMEVFWRKRFAQTSIDDLEAATGVKRGSLYNAYGGKAALFSLAFDRYGEKVQEPLLHELDKGSLREALAQVFGLQIGCLDDPALPPGCMIANSLSEVGDGEEALDEAVRKRLAANESALYDRLISAQSAGELPAGQDVRALARFLQAMLLILPILHRATDDRRFVEDVAAVALRVLHCNDAPAGRSSDEPAL